MQGEKPLVRAQRLALVFRGAGTRWALPASAVLEVVQPPADRPDGAPPRSGLAVEDFSALLGERAEAGPSAVTLVLDRAPPRALLVDAVEEVADLADAAFFHLPAAVQAPTGALIRGAVQLAGRLVLEADPQVLAELQPADAAPVRLPVPAPASAGAVAPARALVFEVGEGRRVGTPLPLVTGVLQVETLCRVPRAPVGHLGLLCHERSLLPIFDLSAIAGGPPTRGGFAVAMELGGSTVGIAAAKVIGVVEGFGERAEPEPGGVSFEGREGRRVFFPDWEAWFPGVG